MKTVLRRANSDDIETIANHNILMALETENKHLDQALVSAGVAGMFGEVDRGFYLIAEVAGETAGSLMITYEWSDWRNANMWWFQSVFIKEKYRRLGLFREMYGKIREMAVNQGICLLRLYVEKENSRAKKTYESLGMSECRYFMYEEEI